MEEMSHRTCTNAQCKAPDVSVEKNRKTFKKIELI